MYVDAYSLKGLLGDSIYKKKKKDEKEKKSEGNKRIKRRKGREGEGKVF